MRILSGGVRTAFSRTGGIGWTGGLIESGASLISKKILFRGSILIRASVVSISGSATSAEPSLGVELVRTIEKHSPPLVERVIRTCEVLIGAPAVPATFQVRVVRLERVCALLWEVILKGAPVSITCSCVSDQLIAPLSRESRARARKRMVRGLEGSRSSGASVPARTSSSRGNMRVASMDGGTERKSGPWPSSGAERARAGPRSRCSQLKKIVSPSGSLPVAVRMKGVPVGMVYSGPALTLGGRFSRGVDCAQWAKPLFTKSRICLIVSE